MSLPSGENWMLAFSRSSPFGHGDLVLRQVVLHEGGRRHLQAVGQLGHGAGDQHHEPMERIRLEALDANLPVPLAQCERVERLPAGDVDDFDLLHLRFDGVEPRAVTGHRRPARDAGLVRDGPGDLPGRFTDDLEVIGKHADVQGAGAWRHRLGRGRLCRTDDPSAEDHQEGQ
jgi:hypothetical protein